MVLTVKLSSYTARQSTFIGKTFFNVKTLCNCKEITDTLLLVLMLIKETTVPEHKVTFHHSHKF